MKLDLGSKAEQLLADVDAYGIGCIDDSRVELLEALILDCNEAASDVSGETALPDSIYDRLVEILQTASPGNEQLQHLWEGEGDITDYSQILVNHPMQSIRTVKSWEDPLIGDLLDSIEPTESLFLAYKVNGHGVRVVYQEGELVLATSRARASAGRDLTRQMINVLGQRNPALEGYGMVEIRGELALRFDNLPAARKFNPALKSAFSAVSSLVKPSSSAEENELLDFLAYRILFESGTEYDSKEEEYDFLQSLGLQVPEFGVVTIAEGEDQLTELESALQAFEESYDEFGYFCDGLVVEVNDQNVFRELGTDGAKTNLGNLAFKVGIWKQDMYTGTVSEVIWTRGKSKLSPVALVDVKEGGVLTAQGNRVGRVPLYEPKNILILEAFPGHVINFRYGGEAGVVPCDFAGRTLTEGAAKELVS